MGCSTKVDTDTTYYTFIVKNNTSSTITTDIKVKSFSRPNTCGQSEQFTIEPGEEKEIYVNIGEFDAKLTDFILTTHTWIWDQCSSVVLTPCGQSRIIYGTNITNTFAGENNFTPAPPL